MGIVIGSCVAQESAPNVTNTSSSRMLSPPRRQALIMSVMERRPDDQPEPVPINRFRSHSTFSLVSDLGSSFRGYQNSRIMYGTDWSPSKRSFPKQKPGSIEYPCHVMLSFPSSPLPPILPSSSPHPSNHLNYPRYEWCWSNNWIGSAGDSWINFHIQLSA